MQVLVVLLDVVGQLAHQDGVDLFELAERLAAGVEDVLVAGLPALELGDLAGPLLAVDLDGLAGELELLALDLEDLPLDVQRLVLEVDQQMEQGDGSLALATTAAGPCPVGETSIRYVQAGRRRVLA